MKEPTQEDFEAWLRDAAAKKRHPQGALDIDAERAWVFLCELFGFDFTGYRCCAKRHVPDAKIWTVHPCNMDKEKCWKGSALASTKGMDVIRTIDNMVKEFVANDNMFPLKSELVRQDRVVMVLEDLNKTPPGQDTTRS